MFRTGKAGKQGLEDLSAEDLRTVAGGNSGYIYDALGNLTGADDGKRSNTRSGHDLIFLAGHFSA